MATGTARYLRYILFAFFVSLLSKLSGYQKLLWIHLLTISLRRVSPSSTLYHLHQTKDYKLRSKSSQIKRAFLPRQALHPGTLLKIRRHPMLRLLQTLMTFHLPPSQESV